MQLRRSVHYMLDVHRATNIRCGSSENKKGTQTERSVHVPESVARRRV
jgi:hypothetical protein